MILVIGYGNPLRCDDGIGQVIAQSLEGWREDVRVMTTFQLTPELVEPISRVRLVIFVDARAGDVPGTVVCEAVEPQPTPVMPAHMPVGTFTHNVTPSSLLSISRALYGLGPAGVLISIVAASFEYGDQLSPQLRAMMPALLGQVREIIDASARQQVSREAEPG